MLDYEADKEVLIILRRPFLAIGKTLINMQKGELTMQVNDQQVLFNVLDAIKNPDDVEDCNFISVVDFAITERLNSCCSKEEIKAATCDELEDEDPKIANIAWLVEKQLVGTDKYFESLDLSNREVKPFVPSIESPPISEKRLNLIMKEIAKKEIIKWLDTGIIYPISDKSWESSLPDIFTGNGCVSQNATARSRINVRSSPEGTSQNLSAPSSKFKFENASNVSPPDQGKEEIHPIFTLVTQGTGELDSVLAVTTVDQLNPLDISLLNNQMETQSLQPDNTMEDKSEPESRQMWFTASVSEGSSGYAGFMEPDEVSITSISAAVVPLFPGSRIQKIKLLHNDVFLQLCCSRLKIRFEISRKFTDQAGRPKLSFLVDASQSLCTVLDACEVVVKKLVEHSGSSSEWSDVVTRKGGFFNHPAARLRICAEVFGNAARYATEIYRKDASGNIQKLMFDKFDAAELKSSLKPGTFVDAFLSLDPYDYQQRAGIRLVAEKLITHYE
ncbi:protein NEN1 [Citrus sinensis]|uniref:Protein NEN1 n=1 Tax=Citrus sinensis TaxID=2711 RepID=A0ACB8IIW2_CITSI|nr:protein NEN1 [Citrus sinensis]